MMLNLKLLLVEFLLLLCIGCGRYETSDIQQTIATVTIVHREESSDYVYGYDAISASWGWHYENTPESWTATFACDGFTVEKESSTPFSVRSGATVRLYYRDLFYIDEDNKKTLRLRDFIRCKETVKE